MSEPSSGLSAFHTWQEILQQPELWLATGEAIASADKLQLPANGGRVLLTGAGTSAYAAMAIAVAWPNAIAVPTTDLLIEPQRFLSGVELLISLARSGDSPESVAVSELVRESRPELPQIAILCNRDGALGRAGLDRVLFLDPRCNDQSLVMTSSFTNLVLTGLLLARPELQTSLRQVCGAASEKLPRIDEACRRVATRVTSRLVVLASPPLTGWAREAGLKSLEMCAGRFPVMIESFLGVRHGPMSFIKEDTVVLCLLSSDPVRLAYELDLVDEFRRKNIGYLVGITSDPEMESRFDDVIPAVSGEFEDCLRTPFESLGPQLLGFHLSLSLGLNPDDPSPDGIINRVVEGFRIHPFPSHSR